MSDIFGSLASDIAADIGNSYQDILLQDSSLQNDRTGLPDDMLGRGEASYFPGQEADAAEPMTGEVLPPETDAQPVTDVEALPQTVEGDFQPVQEAEPQPAPEPVAEIEYRPGPEASGDVDPDPSF